MLAILFGGLATIAAVAWVSALVAARGVAVLLLAATGVRLAGTAQTGSSPG